MTGFARGYVCLGFFTRRLRPMGKLLEVWPSLTDSYIREAECGIPVRGMTPKTRLRPEVNCQVALTGFYPPRVLAVRVSADCLGY